MPTRGRQTSIRIGKITGTCYCSLGDAEISAEKPGFCLGRTGSHQTKRLSPAGSCTEVIEAKPHDNPERGAVIIIPL